MQREESKIWIDDLLENIPTNFALPIHDALLVRTIDAREVLTYCKNKYPQIEFDIKEIHKFEEFIQKKYNIPFIFDMRGFYADERVDGKIWSKSHFIYKHIYNYFKKKEKEFLQSSQHTISLTKNGKKEIESWNLPNQSPISIIPCCTDEKLFKKQNIIDKRSELGIHKDDFVISYVGSIGTWYMLDEMLDFFKELTQKKENTKLLFIGIRL